jgi:hypothetical protein
MSGPGPDSPVYVGWRKQFSQTGSHCSIAGKDWDLSWPHLASDPGGCAYLRLAAFLVPGTAAQRTLQKWWLDCSPRKTGMIASLAA